jgi:transposase-like protein
MFKYGHLDDHDQVCLFCNGRQLIDLHPLSKPRGARYKCEKCKRVYGDRLIGYSTSERERQRKKRERARKKEQHEREQLETEDGTDEAKP